MVRDQSDLWDRLIAGAVEHETAIASAVAKEAKIERRRNERSNWTSDRQTLAEIRSFVQLRHHGPCDTDDGEAYLRAALPWIAAKSGGIEAEGMLDRVTEWAGSRLSEDRRMLSGTVLVVVGGAFAGGFISGLAGFGTGLTALGIWLYVLEPAAAATLVVLCSVISQSQTISTVWHAINPARVWPMLVTGLLGVPIGASVLAYLDPNAFRLGMGLLLLAYSGLMLLGRFQPRIAWGGRAADAAVGLSGGVLGGLAGLSGALPTIWATLRGWTKDERRGVFQAYNLTVLSGALAWHAASGLLTAEVVRLGIVALPGTVMGTWLGARAYRRLSDKRFHEVVLALLGISGLTLVWARL